MSSLVTVVVSAGGAPKNMLRTCLASLERHRNCVTEYDVMVVAPSHQCDVAEEVAREFDCDFMFFGREIDEDMSGSRIHAAVLDIASRYVITPFMLTLDADCFPIADGWIDEFVAPVGGGAKVTGILHPYAPPPAEMKVGIEHRIRSQLCWENTHVACQLVTMNTLKKLGVGFSDGDDTGLAIPMKAREMGMRVDGLKPTFCPIPDGDEDPEFNRDVCVVYGDTMYHHGGGSREAQGKGSPNKSWDNIRQRVIRERGAEFLFDSEVHRYRFDREEEVADRMVGNIIGGMQIYLQTHDRAFGE